MPNLQGAHVAIIATDGVEESELIEPMEALRVNGAQVDVITPDGNPIQALKHIEKSQKIDATLALDGARPSEYDLVLLPGGVVNADTLRMNESARAFVRQFQEDGKPIAAICHAPWLLVSAGIAKGRTMTSYHTLQDDIRNAGGTWVDEEVHVDGNLITSRKPADIPAFNKKVMSALESAIRKPAHA